jgi:N-carbamoylputrescine amidase
MTLKGAELLVYPTAIGWFDTDSDAERARQLESWITIQRSHAIANAIPVLSCNRVGFEPDSSGTLEGIRFWGNSFVCGAQGEMLAHASHQEETILYAQIEHTRTKEVRDIWPFLRDRRIEAYGCLNKRYCDEEQ